MRTPISPVRSVTETSMMFITPMPPTTSEITAIARDQQRQRLRWSLAIVSRMLSVLMMKKSLVPWRCGQQAGDRLLGGVGVGVVGDPHA